MHGPFAFQLDVGFEARKLVLSSARRRLVAGGHRRDVGRPLAFQLNLCFESCGLILVAVCRSLIA